MEPAMHLMSEEETWSECWHAKRNVVVAAGMPTVNSLLSFRVSHQSQQILYPLALYANLWSHCQA